MALYLCYIRSKLRFAEVFLLGLTFSLDTLQCKKLGSFREKVKKKQVKNIRRNSFSIACNKASFERACAFVLCRFFH